MKVKILKHTAIVLLLAGCFSSCKNAPPKKHPCDFEMFSITTENFPWLFEIIYGWIDRGIHGKIYKCGYNDNLHGFLFEQPDDFEYSFKTCEGILVHEGEKNPIETTYPELVIKKDGLYCGIYPSDIECDIDNSDIVSIIKRIIDTEYYHFSGVRISKCTSSNYGIIYEIRWDVNYKFFQDPYSYFYINCEGTIYHHSEFFSTIFSDIKILHEDSETVIINNNSKPNIINSNVIFEINISNLKKLNL